MNDEFTWNASADAVALPMRNAVRVEAMHFQRMGRQLRPIDLGEHHDYR